MAELNVYGCGGCMYLTKNGRCNWDLKVYDGQDEEDCLEAGDCGKYEEKEFETKLIEIIKQKVNKASQEELEEALKIVESKLNQLKDTILAKETEEQIS